MSVSLEAGDRLGQLRVSSADFSFIAYLLGQVTSFIFCYSQCPRTSPLGKDPMHVPRQPFLRPAVVPRVNPGNPSLLYLLLLPAEYLVNLTHLRLLKIQTPLSLLISCHNYNGLVPPWSRLERVVSYHEVLSSRQITIHRVCSFCIEMVQLSIIDWNRICGIGRALDLELNVHGAPNFRSPKQGNLNVFGVAQPRTQGLRGILSALRCRPGIPNPTHVVWFCTREEPVGEKSHRTIT